MNIFRFVYLTCTFVYIVNSIVGTPQQGRRDSNQNRYFASFKGEMPMAIGSPPQNYHPPSDRGHVTTEEQVSDADLHQQLEKRLTNYHRKHPPSGTPIIVDTSVSIAKLPKLDTSEMTLKLKIEVQQSWSDQRLQLDLPRAIQLSDDYYQLIWNPNTIVMNADSVKVQSMYMAEGRFKLEPKTGKVTHSLHLTTVTRCLLDLTDYPYDTQECVIQLGSALYNSGSVQYRWSSSSSRTDKREPIKFSPEALTASSEIRYGGYNTSHDCIELWDTMEKFSALNLTLRLYRSSIFPLYSFILPFSLIVLLGFLPPFFGPEALTGRITFGATMFIGSLALLYRRPIGPTVVLPYLPAVDVYAGLSMLLAFASLLESCVVGAIMNKAPPGNGHQGKNNKPKHMRHGRGRLGNQVDTVVHFKPPLSVRLPGRGRIKVSAVRSQQRNYSQRVEEVYREEKKEALITARRIDSVTKIVYAVAACGSILAIHFCYRTTKESSVVFKGVETH